ncbi:MAG TPA: hypothetical protein VNX27_01800 [Chthoniobacterales bacterium]|nr:hypothetical protein [Chthoniobacterales bacterium]
MPPDDYNDLHYTLTLLNHQTGQELKIQMLDPPFPCRRYYLKVNGNWAKKVPVASKTAVMQELRAWWVAH